MSSIYALSTPPGKSGVAVLRISGPGALATLQALGVTPPKPRMATLASLSHAGALIDKALVLYFNAPHSFTGEDVVEYHIHGSRAVIRSLLALFETLAGLRAALPGEFTRRAFFNGKFDLTAAEGLSDLIDADTQAQQKQALRLMQGEAATFYANLRSAVLEMLALLEAYIDFPEEEIPEQVLADIDAALAPLTESITRELAGARSAERIRGGVQVAIIGPPNVGKSSLMNLLARRDVAIVSPHAGTTRDVIEVQMDIAGYPVTLYDTAGLREAEGEIEQEGIRRSLARAEEADVRVVVVDKDSAFRIQDSGLSCLPESRILNPDILLLNKSDLGLPSPFPTINGITPIAVSAKNRTGLDAFLQALEAKVAQACTGESHYVTHARHRTHLMQARHHLQRYSTLHESGLELRCEELRRAAQEIGHITGLISVDEVLGQIFSRFCIGK